MERLALGVVYWKIKGAFLHSYHVLTADNTQEVIALTNIYSANDPDHPNLCDIQEGLGGNIEEGTP